MPVAVGPLEELHGLIREAVVQPGLTVEERVAKLRVFREDLVDLVARCDSYLGDMELEREGSFEAMQNEIAELRANADIREALIERSIATAEELDALGLLSHEALDALAEEGRLLEASAAARKFKEHLHPRDRHGRFADKPGSLPSIPKGRGGSGTPRILHTHAPEPVRKRKEQRDAEERERQRQERETTSRLDKNIERHKGKEFTIAKDGRGRVTDDQPAESSDKVNVELLDVPSSEDYAEYDVGDTISMSKREVIAAIRKDEREQGGEAPPVEQPAAPSVEPPFEMVLDAPVVPTLFDVQLDRAEDPETIARNLQIVDEIGLNDWPEKGEAATAILGNAKDTEAKFTVTIPGDPEPEVVWDAERKQLHDQIIDTLLRRRKPDANGEPTVLDPEGDELPKAEGRPRVLFMGGGTASGKSTALKLDENRDVQPPDAAIIDPDEIKGLLPEYKAMVEAGDRYAASGVHEESSFLAKRLQKEAMARGLNVIVDGTGDSQVKSGGDKKFTDKMRAFADFRSDEVPDGYEVSAFYVNAPTDVALVRATGRAMRTGRWVPKPEIENIHKGVSARFRHEILAAIEEGLISDLRGYQTLGEPTKMFHLDENGKFVVLDQDLYDAFIGKADA